MPPEAPCSMKQLVKSLPEKKVSSAMNRDLGRLARIWHERSVRINPGHTTFLQFAMTAATRRITPGAHRSCQSPASFGVGLVVR